MLRPGDTLLGRYELLSPLAEGAGGETWRATGPEGLVVVKVVRGEDRRRVADLLREATVLRTIRHPNIVGYREFSDRPYEDTTVLVTELAEGGDLEDWIFRVGPRSVAEVAQCGLQIVEALEALAEVGVLHRDLKPSNVLVLQTEDGPHLRVADFGISRPLREGVAHTTDRSLTPAYAAPEQHRGDALTSAADLYALGGVLGFLATGQHPPDWAIDHPHEGFSALRRALMELEPERRPTLAQTHAALQALANNQTLPTITPADPTTPQTSAGRRTRFGVALGAAVTGVALLVTAGLLIPAEPAPSPEPSAPLVPPVQAVQAAPAIAPSAPPSVDVRGARPPAPPPQPASNPDPPRVVVLQITSRPWSLVTIDGRAVGRTSDRGTPFQVLAGSHQIRLESEQGHVWERTIDVADSRRLCVQLRTGTEIKC